MTNQYAKDFSPSELEMIAAANALCGVARTAAVADIAAITGRTPAAVMTKARRTRRLERDLAFLERCRTEQESVASGMVPSRAVAPKYHTAVNKLAAD